MKPLKRLRQIPFLISPPFGTHFHHRSAKSVVGSYTLRPIPGRTWKIAQFVLDNIRYPVPNGWRNRIALRNPGLISLNSFTSDLIYSLVGLEKWDWETIYHFLPERTQHGRLILELNLGCRNVHDYTISPDILRMFCQHYDCIIKLPANMEEAIWLSDVAVEAGVMFLHSGNTVPDNPGSLSGYPAKAVNLPIVEVLAKRHPDIPIIGGGGIYVFQDIIDYLNAGAVRFALGSIFFHPRRAKALIAEFEEKFIVLPDHAQPQARKLHEDRLPGTSDVLESPEHYLSGYPGGHD
jgi:dihydroorotate dehydrogenase